MKRCMAFLYIALLALPSLACQPPAPSAVSSGSLPTSNVEKAGTSGKEVRWVGELRFGDEATPLVIHERSGALKGGSRAELPLAGPRELLVTEIDLLAQRSRLRFQQGKDTLELEGQRTGHTVTGQVRKGQLSGRFTLVRTEPIDPLLAHAYAGSYEL